MASKAKEKLKGSKKTKVKQMGNIFEEIMNIVLWGKDEDSNTSKQYKCKSF